MSPKKPVILQVLRDSVERGEYIRRAAESLKNGLLVIMPTDTVYGVAADGRVAGAEARIFRAKSRDSRKPIPILASGVDQIEAFGGEFDLIERKLAAKYWPGPLTLVLRVGDGTEGFRIPDHDVSLELLKAVGGVLRVTSANVSGEPPALTAEEAARSLGDFVEIVLDGGMSPGGAPSSVVQVENGRVRVLREGAISAGELTAMSA